MVSGFAPRLLSSKPDLIGKNVLIIGNEFGSQSQQRILEKSGAKILRLPTKINSGGLSPDHAETAAIEFSQLKEREHIDAVILFQPGIGLAGNALKKDPGISLAQAISAQHVPVLISDTPNINAINAADKLELQSSGIEFDQSHGVPSDLVKWVASTLSETVEKGRA